VGVRPAGRSRAAKAPSIYVMH